MQSYLCLFSPGDTFASDLLVPKFIITFFLQCQKSKLVYLYKVLQKVRLKKCFDSTNPDRLDKSRNTVKTMT